MPFDIRQAIADNDTDRVIRWYRVMSLFSPFFFEREVLGFDKMVEHFHGEELELFTKNLEDGILKQAVEFPRGHYKTTIFTIGYGIWLVLPVSAEDRRFAIEELGIDPEVWDRRVALHNRNYTQLLAFENSTNSSRKLTEIKRIFESVAMFRACFPEIAYDGTESPWSSEALTIRRDQKYIRVGEATFQAIGVGGAVQSQHYDIIWEDDCVGRNAIQSRDVMEGTIEWHGLLNGAMNGAVRGMETWRFLVSNPWGFHDLNAAVRRNEKDFVFHTRKCIEPGEDGIERPIFPEQFSLERLENLRTSAQMNKYQWAAQYLCTPIAPGDESVDASKIHRYSVEEDGKIICECGFVTYPSHLKRYGHYDPFNAKTKSMSTPAIVIIGLSTDGHVFLLNYFVTRGEYGKIYDKIIELNDTFWPEIWTYEDVGAQNMCEFYLKEKQKSAEFKAAGHRYFRRIMPIGTRGRAKEIRITDSLFPWIENRKFAARRNHETFFSMLATWPHPRPDDDYDLLDALAQGPNVWKFPVDEATEKALKIAEEEQLAQIGRPYGWSASGGIRVQ